MLVVVAGCQNSWDFGKFFVIKESLALMYKELQLPSEALLKYQVRTARRNTLDITRELYSTSVRYPKTWTTVMQH